MGRRRGGGARGGRRRRKLEGSHQPGPGTAASRVRSGEGREGRNLEGGGEASEPGRSEGSGALVGVWGAMRERGKPSSGRGPGA